LDKPFDEWHPFPMFKSATLVLVFTASLSAIAQSGASHSKTAYCSDRGRSVSSRYPDSLKGSGIQGTVLVRVDIDTKGCVHDAVLVKKLHPELDKIAQRLVYTWKFEPAKKDGLPVRVLADVEVAFKEEAPK
jgi:TonB family protein